MLAGNGLAFPIYIPGPITFNVGPLTEAADMLPRFTAKKGTQNLGAAGHGLSFTGANAISEEMQKAAAAKVDCHRLTLSDAEGRELELVHPIGVEPITF